MTKPKHCAENERIKRRYLIWMKESRGYSTASVDMAAAAISRFETYTGHRNFKKLHVEQARAFKSHLSGAVLGVRSGERLSKATITSTLRQLKAFFLWLADQPGYRSKVRYSDAAYFTPLAQDERIANGNRGKPVPELHEIMTALEAMPAESEIERRDRAIIAFLILTGGRNNAVTTLKLKHVDVVKQTVFWDAREVRTKRAKTFRSHFYPVGGLPLEIVRNWVHFLTATKGYGPDDPLFPASHVNLQGPGQSPVVTLSRQSWKTTSPLRRILASAFGRAGLTKFNPHSFRFTLAHLADQRCNTMEEHKAWSQNLGHSKLQTTLTSYGTLPEHRQCEVIARLSNAKDEPDDLAAQIADLIRARQRQGT